MEYNRRLKKIIGIVSILVIILAVFFVVRLFSPPKKVTYLEEYLISGEITSVDQKNKSFTVNTGETITSEIIENGTIKSDDAAEANDSEIVKNERKKGTDRSGTGKFITSEKIVTVKTKRSTDITVFKKYKAKEFEKIGIDIPENEEKKAKFKNITEKMIVDVLVTEVTRETDQKEFVAKNIRIIDEVREVPVEILNTLQEESDKKAEKEKLEEAKNSE